MSGVRSSSPSTHFGPTAVPRSDISVDPVDSLVQIVLRNNLDLSASQKDVESNRALAGASRWEALPSIDVVGSLGSNGLLGTSQVVSIPGFSAYRAPPGTFGAA